MIPRNFILVFLFFVCVVSPVCSGEISPLPEFSKADRVLILVPHPDDETIGAGGVIQKALAAGAEVKVVLMTNGENNELSFIFYKKRLVLSPQELLQMGETRSQETAAAGASLGLDRKNVFSLGYPDYGLMEILTKYWGAVDRPFRSMLSRKRYVPYQRARSFGAPHVGESILKDLEGILQEYQPNKIFTSHPADVNRDHLAVYLFLQVALWDLDGQIQPPQVYPFLVHVAGWPKPRGYFPDKSMAVPDKLMDSDIHWSSLALSDDQISLKKEAIRLFGTQNKYAPSYLVTFARRNELFGNYEPVALVRNSDPAVHWQYLGEQSGRSLSSAQGVQNKPEFSVAYACKEGNLLVRIILRHALDKEMGVSIALLGYKKDVPFGKMPKIKLSVGLDGLRVKDRRKEISAREILLTTKGRDLIFSVPLSLLGSPQRILSRAKTVLHDLSFDETAWRILLIRPFSD